MEFREELMFPDLDAADSDAVLAALGEAVQAAGLAKPGYVAALRTRESEYPTGLAISGGVAIPHTSAEHVTGNTIAAASLRGPVTFGEMGGDPGATIEANTVFMLVIADSSSHVAGLSKLIRNIREESFVRQFHDGADASTMALALARAFPD